MARNVKKKSPEPQLCQPAEIFAALQMLEKERGIPVDYICLLYTSDAADE